jgi:hypothetical protein
VSQPEEISALAAIIGQQTLDLNLYVSFLQGTLAGALPADYVQIERRRALRRRGRQPIVAVSVRLGEHRFVLRRDSAAAAPQASVAHEVGASCCGPRRSRSPSGSTGSRPRSASSPGTTPRPPLFWRG